MLNNYIYICTVSVWGILISRKMCFDSGAYLGGPLHLPPLEMKTIVLIFNVKKLTKFEHLKMYT